MAEKAQKTKTSTGKKFPELEVTGRTPPHNLDMERALLCSILIDPDGFARVTDLVKPESFYDPRHQRIYAAVGSLFQKAAPVDLLTVAEALDQTKELETAGGEAYLASLINEVATSTHAEHYARVVQDRSILRRLIMASTKLARDAYDSSDPEDLVDTAMKELFDIYQQRQTGGLKPLKDILTSTHEILDLYYNQKGQLTGVGTGFRQLDELTSGFQRGDLVIIAGRPSMGKTAFSLDLARNASQKYGKSVAFFSLEMASTALAMRLLAAEANLDLHKIRSGKLADRQYQKLSFATGRLSEMPFYIDDTGNLGIMELRARARMMKQQHNVDIIFIDYLQLMKPPKADSREQEVAQISRALKGIARELDVAVVALSQLSRAVEQRGGDKRPQLSDLRDSGAIEQDADVVMFIYREAQYKSGEGEQDEMSEEERNKTEIIIRKQRNGPTGMVELVFHKEYAHFVEKAIESDISEAQYASSDAEPDDAPF